VPAPPQPEISLPEANHRRRQEGRRRVHGCPVRRGGSRTNWGHARLWPDRRPRASGGCRPEHRRLRIRYRRRVTRVA